MKNTALLMFIIYPVAAVLGWLMMVGLCWVLFFILGKIGVEVNFSIWWSGLFVYIVWFFFK